mmetsp:Transcript_5402/g.9051  ORF Transcript_5402/g.9051 Transcript_5402/m.9051 type:complete len:351 (+) Transcript_5402:88-1140(+)
MGASAFEVLATTTVGLSPSYWSAIPSNPNTYNVTEGETLRFRYSNDHNIWQLASREAYEACNFQGAKELAGRDQGGGGGNFPPNTYNLVAESQGVMYIACQVSSHCSAGQKVMITVSPPPTSSLLERICDCAIQSGLCDQTCNAMFTSDSVSPECQSLYAEGVCNSSPVIGFNTLYRDACTACPTASPAPSGPPGSCYVFLQGCNQIVQNNKWVRDFWGEENRQSGVDRLTCEKTRRRSFQTWCRMDILGGAVTMHFNAPNLAPTSPAGSCYFYLTHCPLQAAITSNTWIRDHWGEANRQSGSDRIVCEKTRRTGFATWCGTPFAAVTMHFNVLNSIPPALTSPSRSCYI